MSSLISFLVLVYSVWVNHDWNEFLVGVFIGLVLIGLVFEAWLKRSYKCPECGKVMGKPRIDESDQGREFVYACESCEIRWRTRTYVPDSAG